jgi:UDP-GlcNAc:undecaprenyl-phosphate GlcNAc-1-phosphate transferase
MNSQNLLLFLTGAVLPSFVISLLATYVIRTNASRFGLIDKPGERKVHTTPTPLGGGLGIWLGVIATFAVGQLALSLVASQSSLQGLVPEFALPHLPGLVVQSRKLWILLGAGTILTLLGLADDRRGLPWQLRLGMQFAIAACCVALVNNLQLTAFIESPWITGALSVLWIVALINSFNMLDNMDGLSGGVATIAAGILAAVMLLATDPANRGPQLFVAGFLLVLVGGILGFLVHNRPPAKVFMGDAGSYFIGFCIAVATLLATYTDYEGGRRHAILTPLCVMAVPLYDMATVVLIRLKNGKSPFQPDKNHFSHRLVDLGLTKPQAVMTVYLTTATCGLGALLLHRVDAIGAVIIMLMIGSVLLLIAILEATARRTIRGKEARGPEARSQ